MHTPALDEGVCSVRRWWTDHRENKATLLLIRWRSQTLLRAKSGTHTRQACATYRGLNQHLRSCWLLIWTLSHIHYTKRAYIFFYFHHKNYSKKTSFGLHFPRSFFQRNITKWGFHIPLSHSLSSRCQVQWEDLRCWMPSDTFQNNDNKLQACL